MKRLLIALVILAGCRGYHMPTEPMVATVGQQITGGTVVHITAGPACAGLTKHHLVGWFYSAGVFNLALKDWSSEHFVIDPVQGATVTLPGNEPYIFLVRYGEYPGPSYREWNSVEGPPSINVPCKAENGVTEIDPTPEP